MTSNAFHTLAAHIAGMTPAENARLGPMRVKAPLVPKTFTVKAPGTPKTTTHSPYDQFLLTDPYNPKNIAGSAQSQYQGDVNNATKLAGMGYLTDDQINAQAANRAAQEQGLAASLRNALGSIQTASVSQGNAGTASLGAQNAATAASGNQAASVTGVPNAGVTGDQGARAVLASGTAGQGNYLGSLQAAAESAGNLNADQALKQGLSDIQTNTVNKQKSLAQLLSGVAPVSSRITTMQTANQQVDSANKQTLLSIYQNNVASVNTLRTLGQKTAADKLAAQNKVDLANIQQAGQSGRTSAQIEADLQKTKIAAAAKVKAAQIAKTGKTAKTPGAPTAASLAKARNDAVKILKSRNTTGKTTQVPATYQAVVQGPQSANPYAPKPTKTTVTITPADAKSGAWRAKLPKGSTVLQAPVPKTYTKAQTGRTGWYNLWNQAVATYVAGGATPAQAKAYLKTFLPAGSVPGVK